MSKLIGKKIVMCDGCNQFEVEAICEECSRWLCDTCMIAHDCEEDEGCWPPYADAHTLAMWNQRVTEAWNLPAKGGGDGQQR